MFKLPRLTHAALFALLLAALRSRGVPLLAILSNLAVILPVLERWAREAGLPARASAITRDEALAVLGLEPDPSLDAIAQAHRGLIQKLHPDVGGSSYLASKVNEARDVLLKGHSPS